MCVFGSVSADCSSLGLYVPYALLCLLFASLVHTQYYFLLPDLLRCPRPSPVPLLLQRPYNIPLLEQIYIYISFVLCLSLWIRCEFILLPSFASLLSLPSIWYGYMCYLLRHKKKQREKCSDPTVALLLPSVISM